MIRDVTDVVAWSHHFLAEVLKEGDTAVDLTAGGGRDTLFMACRVGGCGRVLSFDIQREAITRTARLLEGENFPVRCYEKAEEAFSLPGGVHLILASHDCMGRCVSGTINAVVANLGYLPGGDKGLTTGKKTTLAALAQAASRLAPGGRMAVVGYTGHPGGAEEVEGVSDFFRGLEEACWRVLKLEPWNRGAPPVLWLAEKCFN